MAEDAHKKPKRDRFRPNWWPAIRIYGPAAALTVAAFWIALQFVEPAPPDRMTIFAGSPGGAYFDFAERYRDALAIQGIEVEIVETRGSTDNIERILAASDDQAVAGFVQSGLPDPSQSDGSPGRLESLASLYYEPLWVVIRAGEEPDDLTTLIPERLAIGPPGSGTRAVAVELLNSIGYGPPEGDLADLAGDAALAALKAGRVDAAFIVGGLASGVVKSIFEDPAFGLMSFRRAEAIGRNFRHLAVLELPEGAADLAANRPPRNISLVSPAAVLVARDDLHPALVSLILRVASEIHDRPGIFEEARQFPSARHTTFPLDADARRFLERGPSLLQRFLPYWAAVMLDRWLIMLLPLITLMLPLIRVLPPVYRWRIRSRIYRWYRDLRRIEAAAASGADRSELVADLIRLDEETSRIDVPLSYADALYDLRLHIGFLRRQIAHGRSAGSRTARGSD